jgi:hypothetical protein
MILLAATGCASHSSPPPQTPTTATPVSPDRLSLFNGRDLSGFTPFLHDTRHDDPRRVFSVVDGMLRISGDGLGYLATNAAYRDYHLIAEFKWGRWNAPTRAGKARDSGIFLHATGPDGNSVDASGAYMAAVECQVMQGAVGDLMLIRGHGDDGQEIPSRLTADTSPERDAEGWPWWRKNGTPITLNRWGRINWFGKDPHWSDTLGYRGAHDVESRDSEWTRVECLCRDSRITVIVNGTVVNEARDVFPSAGKILIQCEGSEVFYRRLELRPLHDNRMR